MYLLSVVPHQILTKCQLLLRHYYVLTEFRLYFRLYCLLESSAISPLTLLKSSLQLINSSVEKTNWLSRITDLEQWWELGTGVDEGMLKQVHVSSLWHIDPIVKLQLFLHLPINGDLRLNQLHMDAYLDVKT